MSQLVHQCICKSEDQVTRSVVVFDGKIIELDDEGKLMGHDAALKPTPLGALPRCP